MRAAILELNTLCKGNFDKKFEAFNTLFGDEFEKEKFRRKIRDFTAFVKKKSFCKGEKRKLYINKFGIEAWNSLTTETSIHQPKCMSCISQPDLFMDPTKKRSKRNKHNSNPRKTPDKATPELKKSSRRAIKQMNNVINQNGQAWENTYDTPFVDVLRKNRELNLTPRKGKLVKSRENMYLQKKVYFINVT